MEIEIYDAFLSAGVPAEKAHMAADSLMQAFDHRFKAQMDAMASKRDLVEAVGRLETSAEARNAETNLTIANLGAQTELRFTKVDARFDRLEAKLDGGIERLDTKMDQAVERLDTKIDHLAERLDSKIDQLAESFESKIDLLAERFDTKSDRSAERVESTCLSLVQTMKIQNAETSASQLRWLIGTMFATVGAMLAGIKLFIV